MFNVLPLKISLSHNTRSRVELHGRSTMSPLYVRARQCFSFSGYKENIYVNKNSIILKKHYFPDIHPQRVFSTQVFISLVRCPRGPISPIVHKDPLIITTRPKSTPAQNIVTKFDPSLSCSVTGVPSFQTQSPSVCMSVAPIQISASLKSIIQNIQELFIERNDLFYVCLILYQ